MLKQNYENLKGEYKERLTKDKLLLNTPNYFRQ